jgi:3-methyladenine DNA glycosylase Tag
MIGVYAAPGKQRGNAKRILKSQGYRSVGPTSVYAFMQDVGVVNDHLHVCFRAADYPGTAHAE